MQVQHGNDAGGLGLATKQATKQLTCSANTALPFAIAQRGNTIDQRVITGDRTPPLTAQAIEADIVGDAIKQTLRCLLMQLPFAPQELNEDIVHRVFGLGLLL